jgi:hypothetical protein
MKTVESEWVPVSEGLERGRYIARHGENDAEEIWKYDGIGGWEDSGDWEEGPPAELLSVNGQIVRVS